MTGFGRGRYLDQVRSVIARNGWAVQGVIGTRTQPAFAYTVGMTARGLPELITYGLHVKTAQTVLNTAARRLTGGDDVYAHGRIATGLANMDPVLIESATDRPLVIARQVFPDREVRALQLVWPDPVGLWPWQPGSTMAGTPLLGPVPEALA